MIQSASISRGIAVARTADDLRRRVKLMRDGGARVALVPTMGALHDGHLSLIDLARRHADRVVVSIFINPTQFGPGEDLEVYPRDEARDLADLSARGADLAYVPGADQIYPEEAAASIDTSAWTNGLCDDFRPGHFDGVATVVATLLDHCAPDVAVFGEKDYQQLITIKKLVIAHDIPVEILAAPIVRESDGLALSSRNAYLSARQRQIAARLNRVLQDVGARISHGQALAEAVAGGLRTLDQAGFDKIDYLEVRDAKSLAPVTAIEKPCRLLAAAWLGATRLIDNREIPLPGV